MSTTEAPTASENEIFPETRWSLVRKAKSENVEIAERAVSDLCEAYWLPLYVYMRGLERSPEDTKDLVQGFFLHVLRKDLFQKVMVESEEKQPLRLRAFLLTCIKNFRIQVHRKETTIAKGGQFQFVAIDAEEGEREFEKLESKGLNPDEAFDRSWALQLIERAQTTIKGRYEKREKGNLFSAIAPLMVRSDRDEFLHQTAPSLGMKAEQLRTELSRLRGRIRKEIRKEVERTVDVENGTTTVDEELAYLMRVVS